MLLSARSEKIIRILARFPSSKAVTAAVISEELGLSRRSVLRELPSVEKWLTHAGFELIRKPGSGLILNVSAERRQELLDMLGKTDAAHVAQSREQRQKLLHRELLAAKEPIKAQYFTERLGISEGTLASDLDEVADVLERYQLRLVRRPGLGIFIEGEEYARRQAIAAVVCEQINEQQLLTMLRGNEQGALPVFSRMMGGIDDDIAEQVHQVLERFGEEEGIRFSDSGFIGLFVHICLALQRLRLGEQIQMEEERLGLLHTLREFSAAQRMAQRLSEDLKMDIPPSEIGFIAVHLSGARIWPAGPRDLTESSALDIRQTVIALVENVGAELQTDFRGDDVLINDLCSHIQPAIGRLRASIPLENPQLDSIMTDYPEIYSACEKGARTLCRTLSMRMIEPGEIGFLAMHFGAALERRRNQLRRVAVVIVCPSGIGTSRLLAAGLQREFPNLDLRDVMSVLSLDPEKLKSDGIELVVSTVPLDIKFRYIRVNPTLSLQDKMLLGTAIDALLLQKKVAPPPPVSTKKLPRRDDVDFVGALGRELYALLDAVCIYNAPIVHARAELIEQAAMVFTSSLKNQQSIRTLFEARDQLADTYIKPFHALLLHARTSLVQQPCFGYVRLNPAFYEKGRVVLGAVVMLIPEGERGEIGARIMSEISGLLLENRALIDSMRAGDVQGLTAQLETLLLEFYKKNVTDRLKLTADGRPGLF